MSKRIGIVVDSPADFPEEVAENLGLHVLPVHIFVDGKDHLHGVDITNREIVGYLKRRRKVCTRPFFPGECAEFFERLCGLYDEIFSFHISDALSGNFKSARSALNLLFEEEARKIRLIDTGNVSVGQGLIIKKAAELIIRASDTFDLEERLEPYLSRSSLFITVEDLYWLKEGGRVSAFSAFIGGMLDIKPIIQLSNTRLIPVEKHKGRRSAVERIIEMGIATCEQGRSGYEIWVGHLDAVEEARHIGARIADRIGADREVIKIIEVGPTIAAHAGPGSLCLGMLPRILPR